MKRIISFLLAFCMTMPALAFDSVSAETTAYDESWGILKGIGIIDNDDNQMNDDITRAEFAKVIAKIIAPATTSTNTGGGTSTFGKEYIATEFTEETTTKLFTDVDSNSEYYESVKIVSTYGIMKGNPDGSFEPNKKLKYEEALKTLLVICGYEDEALVRGGWFTGYMYVAKKLDLLLDKKEIGQYMTKGDMANLMYRTFDVDVRNVDRIKDGVNYYNDEPSFLREFLDMDYVEGAVTEVENSTIYAPKTAFDNRFTVGGIELKNDAAISTRGLLGRRVKAFYNIDDNANTLLYVTLCEDKDATVIEADSLKGYSDGAIEYYKGDRTVKVSISGMPLIYNGAAMSSYDGSVFDFEVGEVIVINDNGVKSVIVNKYDSMVVSGKNTVDDIIYGKDNGLSIDVSKDNFVVFYGKKSEGSQQVTIDDIESNTTITYLKGSNCVEIYICEDYLTGVADKISNDKITIENRTYQLLNSAIAEATSCVGKSVRVWQDIFGNIFKIELAGTTNGNSGVIAAISASDGFGTAKIKIFLSDGMFADYKFADTVKFYKSNSTEYVKIDGCNINDSNGLNGYLGYVTFDLNNSGEISVMKMPLTDRRMKQSGDGRVLEIAQSVGKANYYSTATQSMGHTVFFDAATKIFNIPANVRDFDEYCITDYSQIVNYESFVKDMDTDKYLTYWDDLDDPIPDALVVDKFERNNDTISLTNLWVITNISEILTEDGDTAKEISVVNAQNEEKTYWSAKTTESGANIIDETDNLARTRQGGVEEGRTGTVKLEVGDIVFVEVKKGTTEIDKIGCLYDCDKLYTVGGKLGCFAPSMSGSDRYYVNSTDGYDEAVHSCISEALAHKTGLTSYSGTYDVDQNPIRLQSNNIDFGGVSLTNKEDGYRGYSGGYKFTLGYVTKKATGFVYITTQDLSVNGAIYDEDGDPTRGAVTSADLPKPGIVNQAGRIGIYWQEWHKYVAQGSYMLLIEYYDDRVEVRKATPEDIVSYEEAGNEASRFLAHPQYKRYFVINDYRTERGVS